MPIIPLKVANRIIALHQLIATNRERIAQLDGATNVKVSITYKRPGAYSEILTLRDADPAGDAILKGVLRTHRQIYEARIASCVRELNQLGAEVPE